MSKKYCDMNPEQRENCRKKKLARYHLNKDHALKIKRLYNQTDAGVFSAYKSNAKRRGLIISISFKMFKILINSPCSYCGASNCRGVDRIDSSLGYVADNCSPCCGRCNEIKNKYSIEETLNHLKKMIKHCED